MASGSATGVPTQLPVVQTSVQVAGSLSLQDVPSGRTRSIGHAPEDPVQLSGRSHWPDAPRQTTALDWKRSTQALLLPEQ
jgi:hypothetical protein